MGLILYTAVEAVVPIILLILLGVWLRHRKLLSDGFLNTGNKLVFRLGLPCMLFVNVYSIESLDAVHWDVILYACAMILLVFFLGLVTAVLTTPVPERRGVILQCSFRSNSAIIGLTLAAALGGPEAEAVAACTAAVTIPLFNVLAVIALSMFSKGEKKQSFGKICMDIVKNPLIHGVLLGLLCLGIRWLQAVAFGEVVFRLNRQLSFVYTALQWLKTLTTPLSLIVLGGQFVFSAVKELKKEIIVSTLWRVVFAPTLAIGGAVALSKMGALNCGVNEFPALVGLFDSPVAVSSAIMASQMDNDEQLATQLVVWTTIFSAFTIFATVCILMAMGLLNV